MNREVILSIAREAGIVTGANLKFSEGYRYRSVGAPSNVREDVLVEFAEIVAKAARAEEAEKLKALETFHNYFYNRCETLFMHFGMEAVDLFNAASTTEHAAIVAQEKEQSA